ncbi:hypothetical protein [Ruminococcus gauvreauii]|uniref:Uncharacterized protein n=1 Tax=Ruminococcus gauvreauii TaxID=438033 RepID=A0ABY5VDX5_9FIRM|nr:hypothetical protein [Ruminococcus gauvreauii]UWP58814.1 hypothetical protein NQ502_15775 [Ruminococcus gauvreauii]
MAAEYLHVGIPVTNKKPDMIYNNELKLWMTDINCHDFKIEYLKFEEGTPFPEVMHRNPHIAYKVDDMDKYLNDADEVIFPPTDFGPDLKFAFIIMDGTIMEILADR